MKASAPMFALLGFFLSAMPAPAGGKAEPFSIVFNIKVDVPVFDYDHYTRSTIRGQSTGKDNSQLSGEGFIDHGPDPNDASFYVTLTDANGDRIVLDLSGKQHPLEISELISAGYYDAKAGGVYKVAEATGRYAGFKDRGTFVSHIKYFPRAPWYQNPAFSGEGTLALMGSTPIEPLPKAPQGEVH